MSQFGLVFYFFNPCFGCRSLAILLVSLPGSKFACLHITKIIVLLHLKKSVCIFGIEFFFPAHGYKLSGSTPCAALICKLSAFPAMLAFYFCPLLCIQQGLHAFEFGFDQIVLTSTRKGAKEQRLIQTNSNQGTVVSSKDEKALRV